MAKNQVTEEQLSRGLQSMGGFGGLTQRPRRDHPFRTSQEEPVKVIDVEPRVAPKAAEQVPPKAVEEEKLVTRAEIQSAVPVRQDKVVSMEARRVVDEVVEAEESQVLPVTAKQAAKKKQSRSAAQPTRKADVFSERITLQLSPKMRDKADALAKDLQRLRTSKDERITANTVMRVAIKLVLDKFKPGAGETVANTEEELFELVKKQLCEG